MGACGSCQHSAVLASAPAPLFQIRRGYRALWNNLAFTVETDSNQWTLHVEEDAGGPALYTAHRGGASAAQIAAAEFAIFRVLGRESRLSPDRLAKDLKWQEYWCASGSEKL